MTRCLALLLIAQSASCLTGPQTIVIHTNPQAVHVLWDQAPETQQIWVYLVRVDEDDVHAQAVLSPCVTTPCQASIWLPVGAHQIVVRAVSTNAEASTIVPIRVELRP